KEKAVLRSYEREILRIEGSSIIEYAMTNMADRGEMLPKLVEILPQKEVEESLPYPHEGEEFVYVLEGILTLQIEDDIC
ncbi:cupin domain-containing protein, partial [Desulfovibrio desulfuricans]